MNLLVPQARLRYSTCSGVGFIRILCAVFILECLLSRFAVLTQSAHRTAHPIDGSSPKAWGWGSGLAVTLPAQRAGSCDRSARRWADGLAPPLNWNKCIREGENGQGEVWSGKSIFPTTPQKERLVHPLLETPGLSSPIS